MVSLVACRNVEQRAAVPGLIIFPESGSLMHSWTPRQQPFSTLFESVTELYLQHGGISTQAHDFRCGTFSFHSLW